MCTIDVDSNDSRINTCCTKGFLYVSMIGSTTLVNNLAPQLGWAVGDVAASCGLQNMLIRNYSAYTVLPSFTVQMIGMYPRTSKYAAQYVHGSIA